MHSEILAKTKVAWLTCNRKKKKKISKELAFHQVVIAVWSDPHRQHEKKKTPVS